MATLAPDDFEKGVLITGHHSLPLEYQTLPMGGTQVITVPCSQDCRFHNKIYKIVAIQLPYIIIELVWNDIAIANGGREMVDTRRFVFMKVESSFLQAARGR